MTKLYGKIFNIAAGKLKPIDIPFKKYCLLNMDLMYSFDSADIKQTIGTTDDAVSNAIKLKPIEIYSRYDVFKFMGSTRLFFDMVCAYRFLEHVSRDQITYFIYLISTCTKPGALIDIIVPNYLRLADIILTEKVIGNSNFEAENILLTTELLNEKDDPHCSIWTPERLKYFWELEGRFKVVDIDPCFDFDGRDIYLRMRGERI